MATLPPVLVELKASISEFSAKMGEARAEMTRTSEHGGSAFGKMGALIGTGAAAGGVALIGLAGKAIEMADSYEKQHASLGQAIQNTGHRTAEYSAEIARADSAGEKFGFTTDQVEGALARSVVSTQSVSASTDYLTTAMDLAKLKGVDLSTAMDAVDKAATGNLKPLKALGIDIPVAASSAEKLSVASDAVAAAQTKVNDLIAAGKTGTPEYAKALENLHGKQQKFNELSKTSAEILDTLNTRIGGTAAAQAETFAGKMDHLKAQVHDAGVAIGMKLIPVVEKVLGWFEKGVGWIEDNRAILERWGKVILDFVSPLFAIFSSGGLSGAMQAWADDIAFAWPKIKGALETIAGAVGSWITATAIPYLRSHFPKWVVALWQWIEDVAPKALMALGQFIEAIGVWTLGTAIPKLAEWVVGLGEKLIGWIGDVAPQVPGKLGEWMGQFSAWIVTTGVPDLVKGAAKLGEALIGWIADQVPKLPGRLRDLLESIASWIKDNGPGILKGGFDALVAVIEAPFKLAFGAIAGFWNATIGQASLHIPDWVPGIGGKGFDFPKMPTLAAGGIVTAPTIALIGEAGPEAVVPLSRGGGGGDTYITIHVAGSVTTEADLVATIQAGLLRAGRGTVSVGLG